MALHSGRVLVVEDHASIRGLLNELLGALGYTVRAATTGEGAIEDVETFHPDLVLLDLTLPGIAGAEVLDHLRQTHPDIPVVVMTGDPQRATGILERGAVAYLAKPFNLETLTKALAKVFEGKGNK